MPNSIIEAYAAGLPIVTTDAGGIPYIVTHERTALMVASDDHSALAAGALRLLRDPALALRLADAGRQDCLTKYVWPAVRDEWTRLYSSASPRPHIAPLARRERRMNVLQTLAKLRGRSLAELRERTGQRSVGARSASGCATRASRATPRFSRALRGAAASDRQSWREHFATRTAPRLFRGFAAPEEASAAIRRVDPAYAERVVRRADAALGGRFDLLGYRDLSFGWPVDWHLDPVAGVRAPRRHWSSIRVSRCPRGGGPQSRMGAESSPMARRPWGSVVVQR